MHHYPHHIGDFDKATRHLTRLERSVYRDLLDLYYDTEKPLPLDAGWVCRRVIASTNEESTAVEQVLNEFFTKTPTGWYHDRCEAEISKYHANNSQKSLAGKASAAAKAEKKLRALNGKSTDVERTNNGTPTNQEPRTKNQEPVNTEPTVLVASAPAEPSDATIIKLPDRRIPCPADRLLEAFHTECPTLPRVMKLNDKRRTHLTARWREVDADSKFESAEDGIEVFRGIFKKIHTSDFLAGRAKDWHATFDWVTESSTNFLKVCEGHYDNDRRLKK